MEEAKSGEIKETQSAGMGETKSDGMKEAKSDEMKEAKADEAEGQDEQKLSGCRSEDEIRQASAFQKKLFGPVVRLRQRYLAKTDFEHMTQEEIEAPIKRFKTGLTILVAILGCAGCLVYLLYTLGVIG